MNQYAICNDKGEFYTKNWGNVWTDKLEKQRFIKNKEQQNPK